MERTQPPGVLSLSSLRPSSLLPTFLEPAHLPWTYLLALLPRSVTPAVKDQRKEGAAALGEPLCCRTQGAPCLNSP